MTREQEVLAYALREIEEAEEDCDRQYNEQMEECYKARESGQDIEQVVESGMLYDGLYQTLVDETREYWINRLEAQGASVETIRAIDPDYEPEEEAEWFGVDNGYRAVLGGDF